MDEELSDKTFRICVYISDKPDMALGDGRQTEALRMCIRHPIVENLQVLSRTMSVLLGF